MTLIRLGTWYTSSDTEAIDGSRDFDGNYGYYATVDRMLWTEADDAEQGLGAFFQFSWAPPDRNMVDRNYGAGLVYRGLLPDRDGDTLGVGFSLIEFSPALRDLSGQTYENAIELFYKAVRAGVVCESARPAIHRTTQWHRARCVGHRLTIRGEFLTSPAVDHRGNRYGPSPRATWLVATSVTVEVIVAGHAASRIRGKRTAEHSHGRRCAGTSYTWAGNRDAAAPDTGVPIRIPK